jgi:hypothetical protein
VRPSSLPLTLASIHLRGILQTNQARDKRLGSSDEDDLQHGVGKGSPTCPEQLPRIVDDSQIQTELLKFADYASRYRFCSGERFGRP